jgi:hypothetical protein
MCGDIQKKKKEKEKKKKEKKKKDDDEIFGGERHYKDCRTRDSHSFIHMYMYRERGREILFEELLNIGVSWGPFAERDGSGGRALLLEA